MTPTRRSRSGRSRCLCGCTWAQHRTHARGKPCTRCACEHYEACQRVPPPAPRLPLPPLVALSSKTERVPCNPEAHVTEAFRYCAACDAWERGKVLLTDGTMVLKTHWVQTFEAKGSQEDGR